MFRVSTAAEVREMDRRVIEDVGVPGIALMEVASLGVARAIAEHHAEEAARGVVVVCGGGNNGGDGYGCARWLHGWGIPVSVWAVGRQARGDAAVNQTAAVAAGIPVTTSLGACGLVVDAVFGTGISRPVDGELAEVIRAMNAHPAPVVAVDIPSGLSADTGEVLGVAVQAARTVTFARLKCGFYGEPGADLVGQVTLVDIGLGIAEGPFKAEIPEASDLAALWRPRLPAGHKRQSGDLLVVAGSTQMAGAAVLTCCGALAAGAGLVTLCVASGVVPRLGALPPEVMVHILGEGDRLAQLPAIDRYDAVVAGPGLGGGGPLVSTLGDQLRAAWSQSAVPLVYDADALLCTGPPGSAPRVLTPHPGEAARLLAIPSAEVQQDRFGAAARLAGRGVVLLKGRNTLVAEGGQPTSINRTGGPVLATGGSGDVLAGVIGALLARGLSGRDAARLGAWLHGRAGDLLAEEALIGWTASDVADAVPTAAVELLGSEP